MPKTINTAALAWHYTTGQKFESIIDSQYLDPKKTITPKNERPILWFSLNQHFEPTAQKSKRSANGIILPLGMQGTYELGGGLIRFGYPSAQLIEWEKLARKAGMSKAVIQALARVGLEQSANPKHWLGSFKKINIDHCVIEVFNGSEWETIQGEAL